jgi:ribosomal protein L11 methyltransferase
VVASDSKHSPVASAPFARFVARAPDAGAAERLAAEAWAAGAVGIEEREANGAVELLIYSPAAGAKAVRAAVAAAAGQGAVAAVEPLPETDWSEHWKRGLEAIEVSPRLLIRPSFVAHTPAPGQAELTIDPGQAFGTGGHVSTRLALEWIDAVAPGLPPGARVLDVGTGTGVLALAAVRLAEARAVAFDCDPLATAAARENAAANGLAAGIDLFTGPLDALGDVVFDLVVTNLFENEMLPLLGGIAAHTRPGGHAVFSGLLASEAEEAASAVTAAGFTAVDSRAAVDANGDRWTALLMKR